MRARVVLLEPGPEEHREQTIFFNGPTEYLSHLVVSVPRSQPVIDAFCPQRLESVMLALSKDP
jgi:hypothetical protein